MLRTVNRARVCLGGVLVAVGGAGAACGQVLAEDTVLPASDGGASDGPTVVVDAATGDVATTPAGACSAPPAPSCNPQSCTKRVLHESASVRGAPWGIATDDSFVYWLEQPATNDGYNGHAAARVLRASKDAVASSRQGTALATDQPRAISIAVTGGWAYWTVYEGSADSMFAELRRIRTNCEGSCEIDAVGITTEGVRIMKLVPAAPGVLFGLSESGHVFRFDVGGSALTVAGPLIVKGKFPSLVVTGQHVLVSSANSDTISRIDLAGMDVVPSFISIPPRDGGEPGISNMWTDCTDVWARRGPKTELVRLSLLDAGLSTISDSDVALTPYDVAGDARFVYLAGANEGLFALDRTTSKLEEVGGIKAFAVATDAEGTYWGEHDIDHPSAGTIYMMVK